MSYTINRANNFYSFLTRINYWFSLCKKIWWLKINEEEKKTVPVILFLLNLRRSKSWMRWVVSIVNTTLNSGALLLQISLAATLNKNWLRRSRITEGIWCLPGWRQIFKWAWWRFNNLVGNKRTILANNALGEACYNKTKDITEGRDW